MDFNLRKNNEKLLAIITIIVIAFSVLYLIIVKPQLDQRTININNLNQMQLKLIKMQRDLLVKDQIEKTYSQMSTLLESSGSEQQEKSKFTRELSDLYTRQGVNIRSVKLLAPIETDFYRQLQMKVEMSSHVKNIIGFIAAIHNSPMPIKIEQFSFKPTEIEDTIQAAFLVTKIIAKSDNEIKKNAERKNK